MKITQTQRGFRVAHFPDLYNEDCSIQESSLADTHALWLGTHEVNGHPARMHLGREHARVLVELLQHFIETGELPDAVS